MAAIGACGSNYSSDAGVFTSPPKADASSHDSGSELADSDVTDGGAGEDVALGPCDLEKPFGAPANVASLNSASNDAIARLTGDELEVFFASEREGGAGASDIFHAKRASRNAAFGTPSPVTGVNTAGNEYDPAINENGLELVVSQYKDATNHFDLFLSTRASTAGNFGPGVALAALNGTDDDTEPSFARHDATLCFARRSADIFCSDAVAGAYGAPVALNALTTGFAGLPFPTSSEDGLTMYFASIRPSGAGAADIWIAHRATLAAAFGAPVSVAELNSSADDQPTWLSLDGCRLYFTSTRGGGAGGNDIYVAEKPL